MSLSTVSGGKYKPTRIRVEKALQMRSSQQSSEELTTRQLNSFALNDGTLDAYPKILEAVRSFVKASRGWKVSADGDPVDVDAMTKGKRNESEGKSPKNDNKEESDNQSDK